MAQNGRDCNEILLLFIFFLNVSQKIVTGTGTVKLYKVNLYLPTYVHRYTYIWYDYCLFLFLIVRNGGTPTYVRTYTENKICRHNNKKYLRLWEGPSTTHQGNKNYNNTGDRPSLASNVPLIIIIFSILLIHKT